MKSLWKCQKMAIIGSVMMALPACALAATGLEDAKRDYEVACASCHGLTGKGDGPVHEALKRGVPDLTVLARNNGGKFPLDRVVEVIDGKRDVKVHGTREMPVWGNSFRLRDGGPSPASRIRGLAEYLDRLQAR